jgi:hypothetical protein
MFKPIHPAPITPEEGLAKKKSRRIERIPSIDLFEEKFICHKVCGSIWYAYSEDDCVKLLRDDVAPGKKIQTHPGIVAPYADKSGVFEKYQVFEKIEDLIHAHWKITYMTANETYPPDNAVIDRGETFFWDGKVWVLLLL